MDPRLRVGPVRLAVRDLAGAAAFYAERVGLRVRERASATDVHGSRKLVRLGAGGDDLLVLESAPLSRRASGTTGLYHFAILVPSRPDLARALARLAATRTPLTGAADHGVSEALYLDDPEGNGIEIYRDRPRDEWPFEGESLAMGTDPLDLDGLLEAADERGAAGVLPNGTGVGHVHLHVGDLEAAERFYAGILGFDVTQRYGSGALFLSAGGYHHHVGLNTWLGAGAPPPPPGAAGLRRCDFVLSSRAETARLRERLEKAGVPVEAAPGDGALAVRDPSGHALKFVARAPRG